MSWPSGPEPRLLDGTTKDIGKVDTTGGLDRAALDASIDRAILEGGGLVVAVDNAGARGAVSTPLGTHAAIGVFGDKPWHAPWRYGLALGVRWGGTHE